MRKKNIILCIGISFIVFLTAILIIKAIKKDEDYIWQKDKESVRVFFIIY